MDRKYDRMDKSKSRRRRPKVEPELDGSFDTGGAPSIALQAFQVNGKKKKDDSEKQNIKAMVQARHGASKWLEYTKTRRKGLMRDAEDGNKPAAMRRSISRKNTSGKGLDELKEESAVDGITTKKRNRISTRDQPDGVLDSTTRQMIVASNRTLLQYFAKLGAPGNEGEEIDLDFVESLFRNGARIDCTDIYNQTVMHEVARAWHTDVARFLMENGGNPNQRDYRGRTPLHVAAAVDYPEMVKFLVENGADIEATTEGDGQTPCHFAAKNDAIQSLKMLLKLKCNSKYATDYKNRTPLQLAAELDRSETARLLVDTGAECHFQDDSGQPGIVWMIAKMAPIAKVAMDQFHVMDRANRRQYYHLNRLEPDLTKYPRSCANNVLATITSTRQYDLVTHPAVKRLISVKWKEFGVYGAWFNVIQSLIFILLYTVLGVYPDWRLRYIYTFPTDIWRIIFWILAIAMTIYQIVGEIIEYYSSLKKHNAWKRWRTKEIERDLEFCHPRWPEEEEYLKLELDELDKQAPTYFNDFWNILDWFCYVLLLICIITHIVDVALGNLSDHSIDLARGHIRLMAINLIFLWLRLMKSARAFELLGPFIVILGKMLGDCLRFVFLYGVFYAPFFCAFWMVVGGTNIRDRSIYLPESVARLDNITIEGYDQPWDLAVSLFRLTLVDDYPFSEINEVDPLMGKFLIVAWLALSAILCLNLFIALLSDTFQRVYDNAYANAVMQKAQTIVNLQEQLLTKKQRDKHIAFINKEKAPENLYYDDDLAPPEDDLQKVTIQIKEDLFDLADYLHSKLGAPPYDNEETETLAQTLQNSTLTQNGDLSAKKLENEVDILREEIEALHKQQQGFRERYKRDMTDVKNLLLEVLTRSSGGQGGQGGSGSGRRQDDDVRPESTRISVRSLDPQADDIDDDYVRAGTPRQATSEPVAEVDVDVLAAQLEPTGFQFGRMTDPEV